MAATQTRDEPFKNFCVCAVCKYKPCRCHTDWISTAPEWLPRWFHEELARLGGFFWLPCSLCGSMHGGHEWHAAGFPSIPADTPGTRMGVCTKCKDRPETRLKS